MKKLFLIFIYIIFTPSLAYGAQTKWVEIGLNSTIRLISDNILQDDGTRLIGIELKMPKNVKTYWRIPGETGIPLSLNLSDNNGEIPFEIFWTYPKREQQYGTHDFVYYGSLILPIRLFNTDINSNNKTIKADIFLGICANVCIPVDVSLKLDLQTNNPNKVNGLRLKQAIANSPIIWSEFVEPIGNVTINEKAGIVEVEYDSKIIDANSIIIDNGNVSTLFSAPLENSQQGVVSFQLFDIEKAKTLLDKPIKITFLTTDGAFEVKRKIKKTQ